MTADLGVARPDETALDPEDVARARRWFESNRRALRHAEDRRYLLLGLDVVVPAGVFPLSSTSHRTGLAVLREVRPDDRVLDVGTGSGIHALLAATVSTDVVAVDLDPAAVAATTANAARNGVAGRVDARASDLFDAVDGRFDLVVFVPPFLWFTPDDERDRSITDEGYGTLTRFFAEVRDHLTDDGRILVLFGSIGDRALLDRLIAAAGLTAETVATSTIEHEGIAATEAVLRLSPFARPSTSPSTSSSTSPSTPVAARSARRAGTARDPSS